MAEKKKAAGADGAVSLNDISALSPKDQYLVGYNSMCCVGWAMVLLQGLKFVTIGGGSLCGMYEAPPNLKTMLVFSQTAALLEIAHAAMGLVRSPVAVTAMQVMSRIVALVALVGSTNAQTQWGAGVMILSWALVEVPRYAFYVMALITGDATKKTPYELFWLRYSLFAVLYPTGIMGELSVFISAANDEGFAGPAAWFFYARLLPLVYVFGSPFMIMNMVGNRKKAFKKRFAKPPPPPKGLCWPVDDKGQRSSTAVNQAIVAAAIGAADSDKAEEALTCKGWRFKYVKHLRTMVELQCKSPEQALKMAQAGLDKAYELFEFVNEKDGSAVSFQKAMAAKSDAKFHTVVIEGKGTPKTNELQIPYKGEILSGQPLKEQVQKWVDYGTIEPSAGQAITQCIDHPDWLNKGLKDRYFVLLGAGSAMGPLLVLMALGANVIAVDLDRPGIWKRLVGIAKESSGTLTLPVNVDPKTLPSPDKPDYEEELCKHAGCNLFTHTPMIRDWLVPLYPKKKFTVGCYAYLDGALHVQVSLAMDAICRDLSEKRSDTSLAYLCTPTDLHLIPKAAHEAATKNFLEFTDKAYCRLLNTLSSSLLRKNAKAPVPGEGGDYYLVNGIVVAQGPNYALAKRMQHWRAIVARSKGCTVSSNIAPSTSTVSVVHNRTFAWAYEGMPYFKPMEIFAPETSNAVMSALLFSDLNDPSSVASPKNKVSNPNQLFSSGSFHGGVWRCAYEIDSIGEASVVLYFARVAQPYALGVGAAAVALGAIVMGMSG